MKKMSDSAALSLHLHATSKISSCSSSNLTSVIQQNFASDFLAGDQEGVSINDLTSILEFYEIPSIYIPEKLGYVYVPPRSRGYLNDIITFVFYLHDHGKSLDQLDQSNLVVLSNSMKFREIKFVETSPEKKKRDFQFIHDILMNMIQKEKLRFGNNDLRIPADLMDLLSLLKDYSDSDRHRLRELLSNHLAILPSRRRLEVISNFSKKADFIPDAEKGKYGSAVRGFQRRNIYKEDWTEWFKDQLGFQVGPAKDCFEFDYSKINSNSRGGANYRGTGWPQAVNGDILRFCRNMATHLQDHIPKHNGGSMGSELDVDLIIMALFDEELVSFQKLAHQYGVLKYLIPSGKDDHAAPSSTTQRQNNTSNFAGPPTQDRLAFDRRWRSETRPH